MFKSIFARVLMPFPVTLLLPISGLYFLWFTKQQKTGRFIVTIGILLLLALSLDPVSNQMLGPLESRYQPYHVNQHDRTAIKYIVVLSAGYASDPELPVTSQLDEGSMVRLVEGVKIHRAYPNSKLVLSGGTIFDRAPAAKIMADVAKQLGVRQQDIILETISRDIYEQAKLVSVILGKDRFILVTSASHMFRSMRMFEKLEAKPIAAPAGYMVKDANSFTIRSFLPNTFSLQKAEKAVYEYVGILWSVACGEMYY
ncbi:MAG: envelope biogenesis factor ElyC [Gammaproteobacteria bacterium]|nr:envelope biogenesis factor ElyC [Gammaproteobacteria bacterium]